MLALVALFASSLLGEGAKRSQSDDPALRGWLSRLKASSWDEVYSEDEARTGLLNLLAVAADDTVSLGNSDSGEVFRVERGVLIPQGRQRNVSDLALESGTGGAWALNAIESTLVAWNSSGVQKSEIKLSDIPRHFALISGGLVAVSAKGAHLVDIYDRSGARVREFGERLPYPSGDLDAYLNAGDIAAWRDNVVFAFVYPGLVRSYSTLGDLNWELSIAFSRPLAKPKIQRSKNGDLEFVRAEYPLSALDLAVDPRGYSYLLISGEPYFVALSRGASRLDIVSPTGEVVETGRLDFPGIQVAASGKYLYVLSRNPTKLLRVELPWVAGNPIDN